MLTIIPSAAAGSRSSTVVMIWFPGIATALLALWLVYQVTSLPLWLWRGRRVRRRTARGECLACGYDLKVPSPTAISP